MDDNDLQKLRSAEAIRDAIIDCITVLRAEEKKNYGGTWNDYITDTVHYLMDGIGDICGSLTRNIDIDCSPDYERLTGHEMGVCRGRV